MRTWQAAVEPKLPNIKGPIPSLLFLREHFCRPPPHAPFFPNILKLRPCYHSLRVQVFEKPSLLGSTFASIPDHELDPNNTLTYLNTKLGATWHVPQTKNDFLLCGCSVHSFTLLCLLGDHALICA